MNNYLYTVIVLVGLFFSSCITHRKLKAFNVEDDVYKLNTKVQDYTLQKGDLLSINVYSIDPGSVAIFNRQVGGGVSKQMNEASIYANSYIVDESGKVLLPVIGYVDAVDISVTEFRNALELKFKEHYKLFSLDVKLLSFRLTVLGEVLTPGSYSVYNNNINIIQAIGKAGGFTDYSNKATVKIIRKISLGKEEIYNVNLQDIENFDTDYYYLLPNDIIYIEPLRPKVFKVNYTAVQAVLSTLTLTLLIVNFLIR